MDSHSHKNMIRRKTLFCCGMEKKGSHSSLPPGTVVGLFIYSQKEGCRKILSLDREGK